MRAWVQGLDPRASWERYLRLEGDVSDARVVQSTVAWIRDEFAAAARRHARPGVARLVRLQVDRTEAAPASRQLPSLDEFAADRGLEDFSQAELLELYQEEFGDEQSSPNSARSARRRTRLIERQLEALDWLQTLVVQPPRSGDNVAEWLNPSLASHLERAGINTLEQLVHRVNGVGRNWFASIPAVGRGKAGRILDWLRAHELSIAMRIGRHVDAKRSLLPREALFEVVAHGLAVRPLEKLALPPQLNGSTGSNRAARAECQIEADRDMEAILSWVASKRPVRQAKQSPLPADGFARGGPNGNDTQQGRAGSAELSHTQRSYRKEAERLLLWATLVRGKPLSSLDPSDYEAYQAFLLDPQPSAQWCGPRSRERWSPLWRPFEGPLSLAARNQALKILRSLFGYLVAHRYLAADPSRPTTRTRAVGATDRTARGLSPAHWEWIEGRLAQQPRSSAQARLALVVSLLRYTQLRPGELANARVDHLKPMPERSADSAFTSDPDRSSRTGWRLSVVSGDGRAGRQIQLPEKLVEDLGGYLGSRGLHPQPSHPLNQGAYLLGHAIDAAQRAPGLKLSASVDPRKGVATGTLYAQVKRFLRRCALELQQQGDAQGAMRLAGCSTSWLGQRAQ